MMQRYPRFILQKNQGEILVNASFMCVNMLFSLLSQFGVSKISSEACFFLHFLNSAYQKFLSGHALFSISSIRRVKIFFWGMLFSPFPQFGVSKFSFGACSFLHFLNSACQNFLLGHAFFFIFSIRRVKIFFQSMHFSSFPQFGVSKISFGACSFLHFLNSACQNLIMRFLLFYRNIS